MGMEEVLKWDTGCDCIRSTPADNESIPGAWYRGTRRLERSFIHLLWFFPLWLELLEALHNRFEGPMKELMGPPPAEKSEFLNRLEARTIEDTPKIQCLQRSGVCTTLPQRGWESCFCFGRDFCRRFGWDFLGVQESESPTLNTHASYR